MILENSPYCKHIQDIYLNGYTIIHSTFSSDHINEIKNKIIELNKFQIKPDLSTIPKLNRGHDVLYNLETKDLFFIKTILNNNVIINILKEFLNDTWYKQIPEEDPNFILRAMIARSSSDNLLPLHIDSFIPGAGMLPFVMQVAVILDDQTKENGCTFCLPGSHKWDRYANNDHDLDKVVPIESRLGDVVIWDSRLHHGAFPNTTGVSRWSLISTFSRWWIKQNYQTQMNMPESIAIQLTAKEKAILGYCSVPPINEYERIDIKAGYEIFKKFEE